MSIKNTIWNLENGYTPSKSEVELIIKELERLKNVISRCRCEECGNELGDNWDDAGAIMCGDCL